VDPPVSVAEVTLGVVLPKATTAITSFPAEVFITTVLLVALAPLPRACTKLIAPPTPPVVPLPVRFTVCGLLGALSFTCTTALVLPIAVGMNVTVIVQ